MENNDTRTVIFNQVKDITAVLPDKDVVELVDVLLRSRELFLVPVTNVQVQKKNTPQVPQATQPSEQTQANA